MNRLTVLVIAAVLALSGCFSPITMDKVNDRQGKKIVWLAPFKVTCRDSERQCLVANQLSSQEPDVWQPFVEKINGFNYQPGMFYRVELSIGSKIDEKSQQLAANYELERLLIKTSQYFLPASRLTDKRRWLLKQFPMMPELSISALKQQPYISLSEAGLIGFSGCNRMFGNQILLFEAAERRHSMIKFASVAMTRMACIEPNANQIEHQMTLMLNRADQFAVDWPFLNFYVKDKLTAQFVAQDWD